MRKKIITALLIAMSMASFSAKEENSKEKIIENLREIEESYYPYLDRKERREAKRLMNETIKMIEDSLEEEDKSEAVMSEEAFKTLLDEVKDSISDRDKTQMIESAVTNSKISSKQLKLLFENYKFETEVEDCIYKVYEDVSDKENFIIVTAVIKSEFTKERVNKFIKESKE